MTEKELFIAWLNDAYSTELAMMPVLENHAKDERDYPQICERITEHLEETQRQSERLATMIESLGGSISTFKTVTGKALGLGQSVSTGMFSDELIKNFLADYSAEHLEIASYKSLIATARHLGEHQCVPILEEILAEEVAMAAWLKEHIPMATVESIKASASEQSDNRSSKSGRQSKSRGARFFNPSTLVTLLGIGAIGTGATMLLRSKNNNGETNSEAKSLREIETGNETTSMSGDRNDEITETDLVVTETVLVVETPDRTELDTTAMDAGSDFSDIRLNAAGGNS